MASITTANQRQRMWTPKTRTGCHTCRQRRIKCDEAWPCCLRCITSGRSCEGYEVPIIQYQNTTKSDKPSSSRVRQATQSRQRQLSLASHGTSSSSTDSVVESPSPKRAGQTSSPVFLPIRSIQPAEPHHRLLKYFISAVGSFVIPLGHSFSTSSWASEWSRHAISRPLLLAAVCCRASAFHDSLGWPHQHSRRTLQLRSETFTRLKDAVVSKSDPYETIGAILMLMADNYMTVNLVELESHIAGLNNLIDRGANGPSSSPLRLWMDAGIRWQFAPAALLLLQHYYNNAQTILSRLPTPALTPVSLLSFDALKPTLIRLFDVLELSSTEQQVSHALSSSFSTDRSDLEFSIVTYYQHARQFNLPFDSGGAGDDANNANVHDNETKPPVDAVTTTTAAAILDSHIRRLHCIALLTFAVTLLRKYSVDAPATRAGASVLLSDLHVAATFDFSTARLTREQADTILLTTAILRKFSLDDGDRAKVDELSHRAALALRGDVKGQDLESTAVLDANASGSNVFYLPAWRAWEALCQAAPSPPAIRRCRSDGVRIVRLS